MSVSGREALPDILEQSRGPSGCLGVVGRPTRMSGNSWKALPDVQVWSGSPPGRPEVAKMPYWMPGMIG